MDPSRLKQAIGTRSLREVARTSGMAESTLRNALRGDLKRGLTEDTIQRLAAAVGVLPGWLAFGEGEP